MAKWKVNRTLADVRMSKKKINLRRTFSISTSVICWTGKSRIFYTIGSMLKRDDQVFLSKKKRFSEKYKHWKVLVNWNCLRHQLDNFLLVAYFIFNQQIIKLLYFSLMTLLISFISRAYTNKDRPKCKCSLTEMEVLELYTLVKTESGK